MSPLLPIAFFLASVVAHPPPVPVLQNIVEAQAPIAFTPVLADGIRVPVLLGVMSRCPDALLCESIFDSVLKQTWDIVDISLSFVGKCVSLSPFPPRLYAACLQHLTVS